MPLILRVMERKEIMLTGTLSISDLASLEADVHGNCEALLDASRDLKRLYEATEMGQATILSAGPFQELHQQIFVIRRQLTSGGEGSSRSDTVVSTAQDKQMPESSLKRLDRFVRYESQQAMFTDGQKQDS